MKQPPPRPWLGGGNTPPNLPIIFPLYTPRPADKLRHRRKRAFVGVNRTHKNLQQKRFLLCKSALISRPQNAACPRSRARSLKRFFVLVMHNPKAKAGEASIFKTKP
jgi:hypothetical protein